MIFGLIMKILLGVNLDKEMQTLLVEKKSLKSLLDLNSPI